MRINGILRNIISSSGKDFNPIDLEGKFATPFIFLLTYHQGAKPDIFLDGLTRAFHCKRVQRLLPIAVGPPELWILHGKLCLIGKGTCFDCPCVPASTGLWLRQSDGDLFLFFPSAVHVLHLNICGHIHRSVWIVILMNTDIADPCPAPAFQINITKNTCIHQLRAPVPAKHGMGFSHQLVALHGTTGNHICLMIFTVRVVFNILKHREKTNLNFVFPF